jgi:putative ABC transport system permease protein
MVKNFHFRSMREKIGPLLFIMPPAGWYSQYAIKIDAASTEEVLKFIENKWVQFDPDHPFVFNFFDEGYNRLYLQERRLAQIVNYFMVIGVFLACIGLYSLASLTTEQRTKEIGIRKVIGASAKQIVVMLSKQYLLLVLIGFVVALPVALWILNKWLQSFAYHDTFNAFLIGAGCGLSVLVALVTVAYRSWMAATANPVNSLRNE